MCASLNPKRTVAELKELRALTSDENGAQRVPSPKLADRPRLACEKIGRPARSKLITTPPAIPGRLCADVPNARCSSAAISIRCRTVDGLMVASMFLAGVEVLRRVHDQLPAGRPSPSVGGLGRRGKARDLAKVFWFVGLFRAILILTRRARCGTRRHPPAGRAQRDRCGFGSCQGKWPRAEKRRRLP